VYHLRRIDADGPDLAPDRADADWLVYSLVLPPEQSAVYVVVGDGV
jgi:hypothetical protein